MRKRVRALQRHALEDSLTNRLRQEINLPSSGLALSKCGHPTRTRHSRKKLDPYYRDPTTDPTRAC